ncbi:MAG TPA: hypothetical protein VNG51_17910 [Ktedonobacteraceae bacterium]|nr:hypothetical protein [Ktedonobacteraceae bacterium]
MDFDDETFNSPAEIGSDELLSDDNLRLPEGANILVRVHAVRAWLARRQQETRIEIGETALALQESMQEELYGAKLRRRERQLIEEQKYALQDALAENQQRLAAYEEAQALLEESVTHTSGERTLVEYYLALEELVQGSDDAHSPRIQALSSVQHRVEHVGTPNEEDD